MQYTLSVPIGKKGINNFGHMFFLSGLINLIQILLTNNYLHRIQLLLTIPLTARLSCPEEPTRGIELAKTTLLAANAIFNT